MIMPIAIVPTACGIETCANRVLACDHFFLIAIVPTACGIETFQASIDLS